MAARVVKHFGDGKARKPPRQQKRYTRSISGKAPGIDNITAKLLKTDIEFSTIKIHELLSKIWKFEVIPEA